MAYLKELGQRCNELSCDKPARVEVFNNQNASVGCYCRVDGARKKRQLDESERKTGSLLLDRRPAAEQ